MARNFVLLVLFHSLFTPLFAQQTVNKAATFEQQLSYAYGVQVAKSFEERQTPIDMKAFLLAFATYSQGKPSALSDEEIGAIFQEYEKRLAEKNASPEALKRLQKGYQFLAKKATEAGVNQTSSGLLYQVIKQGDGPKPTVNNKVIVSYKGTLIDGTVFDESGDRQIGFQVGTVIRGWQEGLQLMAVGSEYRFFVPHFLAYRDAEPSKEIKPYSTLIFDIKLLGLDQ